MTTAAPPTGSDDVSHPDLVHPHPDRMAVLATLFGMAPAPVERCRVLELGREAGADLGRFDYVIAHGIYSRVPPAGQDRLLDLCRRCIEPQGVASVSYDIYPVGHLRRMTRDMMLYHARGVAAPPARAARARQLLALLRQAAPPEPTAYHQFLIAEHDRLVPLPDDTLLDECLADVSEPVAFHEFAARAARHGLRCLPEVTVAVAVNALPPGVAEPLRLMGAIEREQHLDFLQGRAFRQTLLCRQEVVVLPEPSPDRLTSLFVAARPPGDGSVTFGRRLTGTALRHLAEVRPRRVSFEELQAVARARLDGDGVVVQSAAVYARETRELAEDLLLAFTAGVVDLYAV